MPLSPHGWEQRGEEKVILAQIQELPRVGAFTKAMSSARTPFSWNARLVFVDTLSPDHARRTRIVYRQFRFVALRASPLGILRNHPTSDCLLPSWEHVLGELVLGNSFLCRLRPVSKKWANREPASRVQRFSVRSSGKRLPPPEI
jgi:hypothetical protein